MKIVNEMAETMQGVQADEGYYFTLMTQMAGRVYCYGYRFGNGIIMIDKPYWHSPKSNNHPPGITELAEPMPPMMIVNCEAVIEELPLKNVEEEEWKPEFYWLHL